MRRECRASPAVGRQAPPAFWRPFPGACAGLPGSWGGPASRSINSPCERSALPVAASIRALAKHALHRIAAWRYRRRRRAQSRSAMIRSAWRSNFSLPSKNLPESQVRLKRAHGISAHVMVRDCIDCVRHLNKACNRGIVQLRKFGKQQVPVTELGETCWPAKARFPG